MRELRQYDWVRLLALRKVPTIAAGAFDRRPPRVGDVAAIVEMFEGPPPGYMLECMDAEGIPYWLLTLTADDVELERVDAEKPRNVRVRYPDQEEGETETETAIVTPLGGGRFRIDSIPVMTEAVDYWDVVQGEWTERGELRVERVLERAGWRALEYVLPPELAESERPVRIARHIHELGGHAEQVFGGFFLVRLPPDLDYDPTPDLFGPPK